MKYALLALLTLSFIGCQKPAPKALGANTVVIDGVVKGAGTRDFQIYYKNKDGEVKRDSIKVIDDKFHFESNTFKADGLTSISLYSLDKKFNIYFYQSGSYTPLPAITNKLEAGKYYKVTSSDYTNYGRHAKWEGSTYSELKSKYDFALLKPNLTADSIKRLLAEYPYPEFKEKTGAISKRISNDVLAITKSFIENNPDADLSVELALRYFREDLENLKIFKSTLTSEKVSEISAIIEKILSIKEGAVAPSFTLKDNNDKDFSLSDLKGKVVLLDFWGDWCGPCRKTHPFLISLHKKYSSKGFEILGVGNGSSKKRWLEAIDQDKVGIWKHVWGSGDKNFDVFNAYNISAFPTKILIDKTGVMHKIYVGTGHEEEMAMIIESLL